MANDMLNPNKPVPVLPRKNLIAEPSKPPQLAPPLMGFATASEPGVYGASAFNGRPGVWGANSGTGHGVFGESANGVGIFGRGAYLAGYFEGDVGINGTLEVVGSINVFGDGCDIRLQNADCAEDFDIYGTLKVEPGTVMVLGDDGTLMECAAAYDKRVAGVVSGAGEYRPAIVLDGRKAGNRQPIALVGKVYCKVDAGLGAIQTGDLLTTSPTRGHAMIAAEPGRAFGTIIGKALRPLASGQGMIPILVALQ